MAGAKTKAEHAVPPLPPALASLQRWAAYRRNTTGRHCPTEEGGKYPQEQESAFGHREDKGVVPSARERRAGERRPSLGKALSELTSPGEPELAVA